VEVLKEAEDEPGTYLTTGVLQGKVGNGYRIKILTSTGKQYESSMEFMEPAGAINNLYYQFEENLIPLEGSEKFDSRDGFKLFADAQSSDESNGLLRWRWTGVFSGYSQPEMNTKFVGRAELPDPLPCSGFIVGSRGLTQVAECTCCICWGYEYSRSAKVSDNINVKSNTFIHIPIGQVLITNQRFHERYYVELEQLSVSESLYNFWKLTSDQQNGTGNLFQPNSVRISGNIKSISNPEEEVLGVFSVSAVVKKSFFIERSAIPFEVKPMQPAPSDCRKALPNGSTSKPEFW
jgi:hypothetical protein